MEKKDNIKSICKDFALILFSALLSVVGLHTFIEPAGFAAVVIAAWFYLSRKYVIYTLIFNILSSVALVFAERISLYQYVTETNLWISVVVSGILHGIRTGTMIKCGGSAGGIDIVACMIQKRNRI